MSKYGFAGCGGVWGALTTDAASYLRRALNRPHDIAVMMMMRGTAILFWDPQKKCSTTAAAARDGVIVVVVVVVDRRSLQLCYYVLCMGVRWIGEGRRTVGQVVLA